MHVLLRPTQTSNLREFIEPVCFASDPMSADSLEEVHLSEMAAEVGKREQQQALMRGKNVK